MIKFYDHPSPNPAKVALFLEESGLPYELGAAHKFKTEVDKEYLDAMYPQNARLNAGAT